MRIEYQNVDIAQEEHVILKGVNFQAEAGEFVYLIGKVCLLYTSPSPRDTR